MVRIISEDNPSSLISLDSVTYMDDSQRGNIILTGSHGGEFAAKKVLKFNPAGAIFNDAGKGKDSAGIKGLLLFDEAGIPAAAVDTFSARIGDGIDTYESGIISAINEAAKKLNIVVGMTAREASKIMQESAMNNEALK